jgi:hypothetical protein
MDTNATQRSPKSGLPCRGPRPTTMILSPPNSSHGGDLPNTTSVRPSLSSSIGAHCSAGGEEEEEDPCMFSPCPSPFLPISPSACSKAHGAAMHILLPAWVLLHPSVHRPPVAGKSSRVHACHASHARTPARPASSARAAPSSLRPSRLAQRAARIQQGCDQCARLG